MPAPPRPLNVWRIAFRLRCAQLNTAVEIAELERRLHTIDARARIDGSDLLVRVRVVGHVGPASAIGEAAQILGHHAANSGFTNTQIEVVRAERVSATAAG